MLNSIYNIEELISLLEKIAKYPPSLNEFYNSIDKRWEENTTVNKVLLNAEDLIEHAPSNWCKKGIDISKYRNSSNYQVLQNDIELLKQIKEGIIDEKLFDTKRYLKNR